MANSTMSRWLRTGARDPAMTSRVLGVFYLAGALLVLLSVLLPHPTLANEAGLLGIAGTAFLIGNASLIWARHARVWTAHTVLAAGTGLISLCVYFAGVAAGIYSAMFVWVVLVAGSFFGTRAVAAHVGWILVSWGVVLSLVEEPSGFSPATRWLLGGLVFGVAATVMSEIVAGRKLTEEELRNAQKELEDLAHHDPLTGIANRRLFELELARELARAKRRDSPLSIVALDLDRFKEYNDEHGHLAGDRLLKSSVSAWSATLRAGDLIARFGGDEFLVLLPDCPPAEAERVAQRLCNALPQSSLECTCSAGIALWDGRQTAEDLLSRADEALYETKKARRAPQEPPD
jgi:diguanylate cyclase (GGDEF)-like protein